MLSRNLVCRRCIRGGDGADDDECVRCRSNWRGWRRRLTSHAVSLSLPAVYTLSRALSPSVCVCVGVRACVRARRLDSTEPENESCLRSRESNDATEMSILPPHHYVYTCMLFQYGRSMLGGWVMMTSTLLLFVFVMEQVADYGILCRYLLAQQQAGLPLAMPKTRSQHKNGRRHYMCK